MKTRAIVVHEFGGPEAMRWEAIELSAPGAGEARIRHTAIGVNFIDTYHRSGLYEQPLPLVPGVEAVGVVEELEDGPPGLTPGDRVGYVMALGAYAERRTIAAEHLVAIPDAVSDETAASVLLKGLTARYLLRRTADVQSGQWVLVHAAAGGVGLLLSSWARHLGARVIGTVGSEEKAELAARHGCEFLIEYRRESFAERALEITDGRGVDVVFDGVGEATFDESLRSLRTLGVMVSFGNASGPVPPIAPLRLAEKGLFLTRPSLRHHVTTRDELLAGAEDVFRAVVEGAATTEPPTSWPLEDAAEVHRRLESRATTGPLVLRPEAS